MDIQAGHRHHATLRLQMQRFVESLLRDHVAAGVDVQQTTPDGCEDEKHMAEWKNIWRNGLCAKADG